MIISSPTDVAFRLFGLSVYWYGILMALAIFVSILVANYLCNKYNNNLAKDIIIEYSPLIIILGIACARLYFCVLNIHYYILNPLEILNLREGGLSIHGGIIGGILSTIILTKKNKTSFLRIMDCLSCATALGQAIGRWGNFFNSEAYGYPTLSQNWGVFIPVEKRILAFSDYSLFHPAFLYESILDCLAFVILWVILLKTNSKYSGLTFFSYLVIYSCIRFFVEQIRIDSTLYISGIPIAELISVLLLVVGLIGIIFVLRKSKI